MTPGRSVGRLGVFEDLVTALGRVLGASGPWRRWQVTPRVLVRGRRDGGLAVGCAPVASPVVTGAAADPCRRGRRRSGGWRHDSSWSEGWP